MLFSSACAGPADSSHLAESTWKFVSIDGEEPASQSAELTFERAQLDATVGCNALGGPWRTEADRLIAGPLEQTEMVCEGPVWGQEKAVGALLAATPKYEVEGNRMVLRSSGHIAELTREEEPGPGG
ncbi:META domain-containing protein [Novosphingobium sp. PC22D]|uniref:META domain-containing protein n=1 Tax=Novosphingobium sp. PC22D TaxID=1962403 RepID=UPI001F0AA51B|nr:META domain-containing protein [Novosphingobium sp. PC22D]